MSWSFTHNAVFFYFFFNIASRVFSLHTTCQYFQYVTWFFILKSLVVFTGLQEQSQNSSFKTLQRWMTTSSQFCLSPALALLTLDYQVTIDTYHIFLDFLCGLPSWHCFSPLSLYIFKSEISRATEAHNTCWQYK